MSFKEAEYNEKIRDKHCLEDKKDSLKSENAKIDEKIIRLEKASNEGFLAQVGAQLENIATWFKNTMN